MRLSSLILALAACGGPTSSAPISSHTDTPAPTTPPPTVAWIDNGFDTPLLPAVASDGSLVVFAQRDNDGGRGHPNLKLIVRDRRDATTKTLVVLDVEEVDKIFSPEDGKHPELDKRIASTNAWLAELHQKMNLVALTKLEPQSADSDGVGETHRATSGDLAVDWRTNRLAITRAQKPLVERTTPTTWLAAKHEKPCPGCDPCENPAFLAGAAVDAARTIAVITVSYTGTDTCWEPAEQQHVVSW